MSRVRGLAFSPSELSEQSEQSERSADLTRLSAQVVPVASDQPAGLREATIQTQRV